jgi:signal transduction histidine kinase/ActR/RegA family two-component response regulator
MVSSERRLRPFHRVLAVSSAATAAAIGVVTLLVNAHEAQSAWPPLPAWLGGSLTLAAIAYVLEGGAAAALALPGSPPIATLLARAAGGAGGVIGVFLFFSYAEAGFGRSATNGAIALAVGGALVVFDRATPRKERPEQVLALAALFLPLRALVCHGYTLLREGRLAGMGQLTPLELSAGLLLCVAVLFMDPERGFMRVVTGDRPAGFVARRLLAASILIPPVVGAFVLGIFEWLRSDDPAVVGSAFVTLTMAGAAGIAAWTSVRVDALEGVRLAAEEARNAAEQERSRLLEREQSARVDLERASRAKDEFIATVSHELRTPISAVLGWARLLRTGKLDAAASTRAVEVIERSAAAQAQLVDDLLDVSRVERGELRLYVRPVDLMAVVEAAVEAVRPAATARGTVIAVEIDNAAGPVVGDPARLQQVTWNLLSNAIKFTPHGGRVLVRLFREGGHAGLSVRDDGVGIDPEFLPHVFERFRQADSSRTRAFGGLGLGLAIVRHLVEAHGGTIEAQSEGTGKGATFTVHLPLGTRLPQATAPVKAVEAIPAPAGRALVGLAGVEVLVVDDDPDSLELVREALTQAGGSARIARSAAEALVALATSVPAVLLSDIAMPEEDGFALIRRIRALPPEQGGRVKAAALTAFAFPEDREQALRAGFDEFLAKPIAPWELVEAVAKLAGRDVQGS